MVSIDLNNLKLLREALSGLPADLPCAVYPWLPPERTPESSGLVPGYLIRAVDLRLVAGDPVPDPPPPPSPDPIEQKVVNSATLNVRAAPGTDQEIITTLTRGTAVEIQGTYEASGMKWAKLLKPALGFVARSLLADPPPEPAVEVWYATDDGLRIRSEPDTSRNNVIGLLNRGDQIKSKGRATGSDLEWVKVVEPLTGYVALKYLTAQPPLPSPLPQPVPPPILPAAAKRIGVHIMENVEGGKRVVLDFLAATQPAGVTLVDTGNGERIMPWEIKAVAPKTALVLRRTDGVDYKRDWTPATIADGKRFVDDFWSAWLNDFDLAGVDYLQLFNEPKPLPHEFGGFNAWLIGILERARERKIKVVLPVFSTGYPGLREYGDPGPYYWELTSTHTVLRRVRDEGHLFALHQYRHKALPGTSWNEPFEAFRHEAIYRVLPNDLKSLPLALLEFGDEQCAEKGVETFRANIQMTITRLANSSIWFVGLWSTGDNGAGKWKRDRIETLLPALKDTLLAAS